MNVSIADSLSVTLDTDQPGYPGPDVCDDLAARARRLFADAMTDARAAGHVEE